MGKGKSVALSINRSFEMQSEDIRYNTVNDSYARIIHYLAMMDDQLPAVTNREIARSQPVFIMVPGILGSKLTDENGKVLWGIDSAEDVDLKYAPGRKIKAEVLEEFLYLCLKEDVYGDFYRIADSLNLGDIKHLLCFAYDWRQDNRLSAKELDNRLLQGEWGEVLQGRRVIFIAHSMGGIVTNYWYNKYYKANPENYAFEIKKMLFLGTPHFGAISSLYTLMEGYSTGGVAGWFLKCFPKISPFQELDRAGYTFPSIYQLLPAMYPDQTIFQNESGIEMPIPLFDIKPWEKFDFLKKWRGVNPPKAFYRQRVKPLLDDALNFHKEMYGFKNIPKALYFYSVNHDTLNGLQIVEEGSSYRIKKMKAQGDGRVPRAAATNREKVTSSQRFRVLANKHGELLKDHLFIEYIRNMKDEAIANRGVALVKLIKSNPRVQKAFIKFRVLIEPPLNMDRWKNKSFDMIKETNRMLVGEMHKVHRLAIDPERSVFIAAQNAIDNAVKPYLYTISHSMAPTDTLQYLALTHLGSLLLMQDDWKNSVRVLNRAVRQTPDDLDKRVFLANQVHAYKNLYESYSVLGQGGAATRVMNLADKYSVDLMNFY